MIRTAFTLEEATDIAEDFEDLVDTDFEMDGVVYEVLAILVCPYSTAEVQVFIDNYLLTNDQESCLNNCSGNEYDVILLARDAADEQNVSFPDIRTFVAQKGILYNFPG